MRGSLYRIKPNKPNYINSLAGLSSPTVALSGQPPSPESPVSDSVNPVEVVVGEEQR
jgi:hypothetical protein